MADIAFDDQVDITDKVCPLTFVKAKVAIEELDDGEVLAIRMNDGEPVQNVPRSMKEEGHKILKLEDNEDGTYTLENGTYTYYVSKSGFLTKTDSFKVTDEESNPVIRIESLEAVPAQSGTVSVQLAGQSTVFCPTTDVTVSQEAKDLAARFNKNFVKYTGNEAGKALVAAGPQL